MSYFLFYTALTLFLITCVFLIMLVLIQKGRGGGLSGAFGGGGGSTAFGTKTGDVLTWATSIVFGIFILLAVALNLATNNLPKTSAASTVSGPIAPVPTSTAPPASSPAQ
jgi:preprotein translocase subunit SecG